MADELHVVGVTADGLLLHAIRRFDRGWQEFRDVGREAGQPSEGFSSASCAVVDGALHVGAITKDGWLRHAVRSPSGEWQDFGDASAAARGRPTWRTSRTRRVRCSHHRNGN